MKEPNIESVPIHEQPRADLLDIYHSREDKDVLKLSEILTREEEVLESLEKERKDDYDANLNWLLNNNNRIDLYQITAVLNGKIYGRAEDEMDEAKAKQLFAYRKIQAILLTLGEVGTQESVELLASFIERNPFAPYLCNTAIDSLSKNSEPNAKAELRKVIENANYNYEIRTRAVLAGLREGMEFDSLTVVDLLREYVDSLGENLCQTMGTYNVIEIAGLLKEKNESAKILDELYDKMRVFPDDKSQWFERDIISTRLTVKSEDKEKYLESNLPGRHYVSEGGIVFGSTDTDFNFQEFLLRHKNKLEKIAKLLNKINKAFGTEPIMYVDFNSGDANEAGWTQNSIYFSAEYIDHSGNVDDLLQSTGHEACERWQSKGFIDVELAKYYLQLMGDNYIGSELDKFRLKYRKNAETRAGHPWDGEREFIAELGSTLLVDSKWIDKIFDKEKDKTSFEALTYLKRKLNK